MFVPISLLAGCFAADPVAELPSTPRSTADPTGAGEPDVVAIFDAWKHAVNDAFTPFAGKFPRAGSDEALEPLHAAWSEAIGGDPIATIDSFGPQPDGPDDLVVDAPLVDLTNTEPCDRPTMGQFTFAECSFNQQQILEVANDQVHFGLWRALQRIHWVLETPDDALAAERWNSHAQGQQTAPLDWFGTFDRTRAVAVANTFEKAWAQFNMHDEIQISCWRPPTFWEWLFVPFKATVFMQSPCSYNAAMAHAIWVGHPPLNPWVADPAYEVCPSYFSRYDEAAPNLNAGQRAYLGAVLLHETLHWNVVGDCGGFPESTCDSVGAIPAYRAFLNVGEGYLKDSWSHDACDVTKADGKCYSQDEGLAMAEDDPAAAIRLPIAYQYFVLRTSNMYVYDHCNDDGNVCFATDHDVCEEEEPPDCGLPGGSACNDNPGTVGCGCLEVDGGYLDDESGYADGAGSFIGGADDGRYCPGTGVVCGVEPTECGSIAACQQCGEDTNVGCPCDSDADCAGIELNLGCWGGNEAGWPQAPSGSGTCLPDATTPDGRDALEGMPWFCLENCEATDQWSGMAECIYNQASYAFDHGTCVHQDSCGGGFGYPGACEEAGMVCNGDNACEPVCETDQDCVDIGFPAGYVCREVDTTAACVPPECAGGDLLGYCGLFVPES